MRKPLLWIGSAVLVALLGCAGWDNPTALEDLQTDVEIEIAAGELETFEEIEIRVSALEHGAPLEMQDAQLEMEHESSGAIQLIEMEREGDAYAAHVMFFQPGEHHIHFFGVPYRHHLRWEIGEHALEVRRHHQVIGPYWVELEVDPAPILEGADAHIHLFVFELLPDGTVGNAAGGLDMEVELHAPDGVETVGNIVEEAVGEYEVEFTFADPGVFEIHVAIDVGGMPEEGEFHIPVSSPDEDTGEEHDEGDTGGHGHGD